MELATSLKAIAVTLVLSLMGTNPLFASSLEQAAEAFERADYDSAFQLFRPHAIQGDADAQSKLGAMYANGKGVPQDHEEAV